MPKITPEMAGSRALNGFVNRTSSALGMSALNLEITTGSSYAIWSNGNKFTKTTTLSVAISNEQTLHFVYFDASGVLQVSTSPWDFLSDNVLVATVYKDNANFVVTDERHGFKRNRDWHKWAHNTIGARYGSGLTGTFDNTTLSITQGVIYDEDINFDTGGTKTNCQLWYRNAGLTAMRVELGVATPYKAAAGVIQYDNAGTLTNVTANRYVNSYVYATNVAAYPIVVVVGQAQHVNLASAEGEPFPSILLSTAEWKLLYRVTYRNFGGTPTYIQATDLRLQSTGPAVDAGSIDHAGLTGRDAANQHPATAITNTPAGNIVATEVQAAINELDGGRVTFNEPAADDSAGTNSIFDSAVVGEAVAFPDLLYLKSDGKWWRADADAASSMPGLRMALETKVADDTCSMLVMGRVRDDDWAWTVGGLIYASAAVVGGLTQTAPSDTTDIVQVVGIAYHADKMIFMPSPIMVEIA